MLLSGCSEQVQNKQQRFFLTLRGMIVRLSSTVRSALGPGFSNSGSPSSPISPCPVYFALTSHRSHPPEKAPFLWFFCKVVGGWVISKTVLDLLQVYLDPKWHTAIMDFLHVALLSAGTDTLLAG